jgi:hypothetical protein
MLSLQKSFSIIMCLPLLFVPACGSYKANMRARSDMELYESKYQAEMVESVSNILKVFDDQARFEAEQKIEKLKEEIGQTAPDYRAGRRDASNVSEFAIAEIASLMHRQLDNQSRQTIALIRSNTEERIWRARGEAMEYASKMVDSIMNEQDEEFGTPSTPEDIFIALVKQTPFLATVGGMYGLGKAGIDNAGTTISSMVDSSYAEGSAIATTGPSRVVSGSENSSSSGNTLNQVRKAEPEGSALGDNMFPVEVVAPTQ